MPRVQYRTPDGRTTREYPPLEYPRTHLLGTDKVGSDVFYRALKGIRTGLIIGGLTTLIAVPFAIFFGVVAGYFGGWIDDIIQYTYATLESIPAILLIIAFMLLFGQGLFNLCLIMGISSWVGLCRILRGETLRLRELEYVQAAEAFGVRRGFIILKHLVPNLIHIVLISSILGFSNFVLAEAVLSYLQIGVEPTMGSWGNMINTARLELARDPIVWWNLSAAFCFHVLGWCYRRICSGMPSAMPWIRGCGRGEQTISCLFKNKQRAMLPVVFHFQFCFVLVRLLLLKFLEEPDKFPAVFSLHRREV